MADPYWRYPAAAAAAAAAPTPTTVQPPLSADRGTTPKPSFPGNLLPEPSMLTNHNPYGAMDLQRGSANFLQNDVLSSRTGGYGLNDYAGIHSEPGVGGMIAGSSVKPYPSSYEDASLSVRPNVASGTSPRIPDATYERADSLRRVDSPPVSGGESNVLFVDGLPTDCTRREIGHLFRPFIGFRELRVVHKEPRRRGDKAMVLCFVEFTDAQCARTAMEALQDYKFDDKKPESPILKIQFAHFPFRLPSDRDEQRF